MRIRLALAAALAVLVAPAQARIDTAAPNALALSGSITVATTPDRAYAAIGQVSEWWNDDFAVSGSTNNMFLSMSAGACLCEVWAGGSVRHGTVVSLIKDQEISIDVAVGPLRNRTVKGVLTFTLKPVAPGTAIAMTYKVSGDSTSQLDTLAPAVDAALTEQLGSLAALIAQNELTP